MRAIPREVGACLMDSDVGQNEKAPVRRSKLFAGSTRHWFDPFNAGSTRLRPGCRPRQPMRQVIWQEKAPANQGLLDLG
jgi:hypothetical protein